MTRDPRIVGTDAEAAGRRGEETAAPVPTEPRQRLRPRSRLKELLLAPGARTETLVPPRTPILLRPPPTFE